ncbi:sigma-70 family RNA polymerase sigma factor [uncultured Polaribacter sp.]|uniref:sigma-70 family RNA polymerase sigma factor n=1 Tax=uncultured Polaribacter sp. TaxID=174711 RepID=UPI00261B4511|nr:sigma-70 family RNA polymerase sigma factor [uncultured Polaribacter sp.]
MTTNQIWDLYSKDLKTFIISKVKNPTIADDILQDTFIKIHTKMHTLKEVSKLKAWCFSVARNSVLNYWRANNKTVEIANLNASDRFYKSETAILEHTHTEQDCLQEILKTLPKKYRDPLFLSDIKGFKQQEVANQLNQTLSTTKSQIQRGRKLISQGFIDCCGFIVNKKGDLVGEIQDKEDCNICN